MEFSAQRIPYRQTGKFSPIVLDYIDQAPALRPFFTHPPSAQGVLKAISGRKNVPVDRALLADHLEQQYQGLDLPEAVRKNITALRDERTFTVTTAHQPNIFTGPLYFIYKILHAIRLSEQLNELLNDYRFVPVFYMGSEDADLEELGHVYINREKLTWDTKQKGAVGRMIIDKPFLAIIERIKGELLVAPNGKEIMDMVSAAYQEGVMIQTATLRFLHALFGSYGLLVLVADSAPLKASMKEIFRQDLLQQTASGVVAQTSAALGKAYKVQATPRAINLFYLEDQLRGRIELEGDQYKVLDSDRVFTRETILEELDTHPERFSPNVILRGIYQESILPNVIFIGGGGEIAYWLQLKDAFTTFGVPYPVLVLRNSFCVVTREQDEQIRKLGFTTPDCFKPADTLINELVVRESAKDIKLNGTITEAEKMYDQLREKAGEIDSTLVAHVESLKVRSLKKLNELEKKMLRAEKKQFEIHQRQIGELMAQLFPGNGMQERVDSVLPYYAAWGASFIKQLYKHSTGFEQEMVILTATS